MILERFNEIMMALRCKLIYKKIYYYLKCQMSHLKFVILNNSKDSIIYFFNFYLQATLKVAFRDLTLP